MRTQQTIRRPKLPTKKSKAAKVKPGLKQCTVDKAMTATDLLLNEHTQRRQELIRKQRAEMDELKAKHSEESQALEQILVGEKKSQTKTDRCFSCNAKVLGEEEGCYGGDRSTCIKCDARKCPSCEWPEQCGNDDAHGFCPYCVRENTNCAYCSSCSVCNDDHGYCCKFGMMEEKTRNGGWY